MSIDQAKANEAVLQLKVQADNTDREAAHAQADDILCNLLNDLGYTEVVKAYHKVDKWYA